MAASPGGRVTLRQLRQSTQRNVVGALFSRFVFLLQILLLVIATPMSVHARAPESPKAAPASKQLASSEGHAARLKSSSKAALAPHGKKKVARKGLSGTASYYANRFHGRKTASGHPYHRNAMTAAHRSLPLGTWVRVINGRNGSNVVVQITDRGPFAGNRVIDLSHAAAADLDMLHKGTAPVRLEVIEENPSANNGDSLSSVQLASGY